MSLSLNSKYVRSLYVTPSVPGTSSGAMVAIMKLIYEFWGFCVNGGTSLVQPGGFATSQLTGSYLSMPVGFESGSQVLLATGSDGVTQAGDPYFSATSSPFSPNFVGKYLVTWKSGSISTDDSIYVIKSWINSSSIAVDTTAGGTVPQPNISGLLPTFTTRTNINYRVVDVVAAGSLSPISSGQYMVLQFNGSSNINPGQVSSQAKLIGRSARGANTQLCIQLSPSGSWDGTQFINENYSEILPETGMGGPSGGGWATPDWFNNSNGGTGFVSLWGNLDYIICTASGGSWATSDAGSLFQIEIPQRLYPQGNDPNPICAINLGNLQLSVAGTVGYGYCHRFFPSPYDTLVRRWPMLCRSFTASYFSQSVWQGSIGRSTTAIRWPDMFYNRNLNKFLLADAILSLGYVSGQALPYGQFSLARAKVRTARFCNSGYPTWLRVGDDNDQWINVGAGIMLPWDGACLGRKLIQ